MRSIVAARRGSLVDVEGWRGVVLAAFPGAVYVAPPVGHLLVVHDVAHGCSPTSVQIDRRHLAGVAVGHRAAGRAGRLRLGDLVIDVRHVPVWSPAPARVGAPAWWRQRPAQGAAADGIGEVLDAAATGAAAEPPLRPIVGRGPGLTPAGDDALVGMLAVLHRATPSSVAAPLIRALDPALRPLLGRTTEISAHHLRLALEGAFSQPLVTVVDDLAVTGAIDTAHLAALLRTGATSGADALAGIVATATWLACRDLEDVA